MEPFQNIQMNTIFIGDDYGSDGIVTRGVGNILYVGTSSGFIQISRVQVISNITCGINNLIIDMDAIAGKRKEKALLEGPSDNNNNDKRIQLDQKKGNGYGMLNRDDDIPFRGIVKARDYHMIGYFEDAVYVDETPKDESGGTIGHVGIYGSKF